MDRSTRIQVVACLWIRENRVTEFEAYERQAVRIMARHGGTLERVVRSTEPQTADRPFEVHVLQFPSAQMFEAYRSDPELKTLAASRAAIIAKTLLLVGRDGPSYAS